MRAKRLGSFPAAVPRSRKDLQTYFLTAVVVTPISRAPCTAGYGVELQLHRGLLVKALNERLKLWKEQVEPMSAVASSSAILPIPGFPPGVDMRWETRRRVVWNEQEHTREEHELVYEISWIKELGVWRCFLRSQRKVTT